MKTILSVISLTLSTILSAQFSAEIKYTETVKLEISHEVEGIDLSGMLPENVTEYKILTLTAQESIYRNDNSNNEETETEMTSDDGSIKIQFVQDDSEEILYCNLENGNVVHQQGFMSKTFLVKDSPEPIKWKIGTEKISYLGYECIKATTTNDKGEAVVAWFTSQIPVPAGPAYYNKLPGVILMVSVADGKREIKATEIKLKDVDTSVIQAPNDGKKVTAEEYQAIQEQKMKEMQQQLKGKNVMFEVR